MCAQFEEKHESVLMTFPRHVTGFHSKTKVKTVYFTGHPYTLVDMLVGGSLALM
jgi:hypothetical protein